MDNERPVRLDGADRRGSSGIGARGLTCGLVLVLALHFGALAARAQTMDELREEFRHPDRAYTQVPFWFWNGDIDEAGIDRQIEDLDAHGIHGFIIHARMGLSKQVGYMTDRWLALVRHAVERAAQRDMIVYLYDEGMYPSGSAHGEVVRGRPDLASQGLRMMDRKVRGPEEIRMGIPLEQGEQLVSIVVMQWSENAGRYLPQTARVVSGPTVRIPVGDWGLFTFIQTPSGGVIRGVHWDEEDNQPGAPASADLLNPESTQRFINATHERYRGALEPFFGSTVVGIFTDEPDILGRRSKRGLRPWTAGLEEKASAMLGYDFRLVLPFLFGAQAADGRERVVAEDFEHVVAALLNDSYYEPLSTWCARNGIALTGHPAGAADLPPQRYFQHPGQDVVWRWVLPGPTSLEGEQSTNAKSAASAAAHLERSVVLNEAYGAYGWRLTMDEMKWLADWLYVRGMTRLVPHAFYYSDEEPRLFERPPDLGWYNLWWDHYEQFADYTDRLSWLMTGWRPVVDVAVVVTDSGEPWRVASRLLQNQIDFHYLGVGDLSGLTVAEGRARLGWGTYSVLVLDGIDYVDEAGAEELERLLDAGIRILAYQSELIVHPIKPNTALAASRVSRVRNHENFLAVQQVGPLLDAVRASIPADVSVDPPAPDLRYRHVLRDGRHAYLITNEGDATLNVTVRFAREAAPEEWDAEDGSTRAVPIFFGADGAVSVPLDLPARRSAIYVFDESHALPEVRGGETLPAWETTIEPSPGSWSISVADSSWADSPLGSWTTLPGLGDYSGTGWYTTTIDVPEGLLSRTGRVWLECGDAHAFVEARINGEEAGVRLWRPFRFDVSRLVRSGANEVAVGVTNTRANELTGEVLPSGLFGPVRLRFEVASTAGGTD